MIRAFLFKRKALFTDREKKKIFPVGNEYVIMTIGDKNIKFDYEYENGHQRRLRD
jgi:hypothetical protein